MLQNGLPSVGEFLLNGPNLWMTCPKCHVTVRPHVSESKVLCDHCGFRADMVKEVWKKASP